jgi:hypothetical protein
VQYCARKGERERGMEEGWKDKEGKRKEVRKVQ